MEEINTTKRYSHYCRDEAEDGRICVLYKDHVPPHKEKHLKSEWY